MAQLVKNLPAMQETQLWSLGQEDPLEKDMATHSSTLAWRIPWRKEQRSREGCRPWDPNKSDMTATNFHFTYFKQSFVFITLSI